LNRSSGPKTGKAISDVALQLSDDPFHQISFSKKAFFFHCVPVFHIPACVHNETKTLLGKALAKGLRAIAPVSDRSPQAALEQIFRFFNIVSVALC
jgi:hypothetical protein